MTDEHLTSLFVEGSAPERDAAFARRVDARIASERRGRRLLALAVRTLVILSVAATVFVAARVLEPAFQLITENSPQFMDVPVPLILSVLAVGFAVRTRRFVRLRLV